MSLTSGAGPLPTGGAGVAGPGGGRTGGTGAVGAGGGVSEGTAVGGTAVGDPGTGGAGSGGVAPRGAGGAGGAGAAGGSGAAGGARAAGGNGAAEGTGPAGGAGADESAGAAGGAGAAEGAGAAGAGDTARPRLFFAPPSPSSLPPPDSVLRQVLSLPSSTGLLLKPGSTLPAPSPYAEQTGGLTERREHASRPVSPVRSGCSRNRIPRQRQLAVPGPSLVVRRPSSPPQSVPLPSPPASSLPVVADPKSDRFCAEHPTVTHLLATVAADPSFESVAACPLVAELCALGTDVFEDMQKDLECLAAAVPHLVPMLLSLEGDPDAPDIPTPRSYAEAIEGPYSSQWQTAMDAQMASWKSTSTYVDKVPPHGAKIVSGMWIFRVKRPPGSPPVFKARYVA
ncbi:unnamed protein product [Closterium sp. NIES-65]|nr:unnamed protein product [Closterium sp. NIES-65]